MGLLLFVYVSSSLTQRGVCMPFRFSKRSKNNLQGVHPDLVRWAYGLLECAPYDFIVTEGLRSMSRQRELKAKGASQTLNSYHLPQADGYGHAIDIAIIPPEGGVTWENRYYEEFAKTALDLAHKMHLEITWGGSWKRLYDTPHYQLEPRCKPVQASTGVSADADDSSLKSGVSK